MPARWFNLAVKVAFGLLMAVVVFFPDLEGFAGKAPLVRALTYPLAGIVVPIGWWLRGRRAPYPHAADGLIGLPFVIDLAGNVPDLYDRITWWDDGNHFWNWGLLCAGVGLLLARSPRVADPRVLGGLVGGFGGVAIIIWEVGEYFAFIRNSTELDTAYTDTLGDLLLSTLGGIAGAAVLAWRASRRAAGVGEKPALVGSPRSELRAGPHRPPPL
ncbi:MAG: hypothetical protein ACKV2O_21725 [Acidimicrobiales bacterium]